LKIKRCEKEMPYCILIGKLQGVKGHEKLVKKLQKLSKASFRIGVRNGPSQVKRYFNRCLSRYSGQDVFCASVSWSVYCANHPNSNHCKNFV
jgi:hypothetical protein